MQECEWFILDATSCRCFRLGQMIRPGDYLGRDARNGRRMRAVSYGEIVGIEFDVDENELILKVLSPSSSSILSSGVASSLATFSSETFPVGASA